MRKPSVAEPWIRPGLAPERAKLFQTAAACLVAEDQTLREAFESSPRGAKFWPDKTDMLGRVVDEHPVNRGLAYRVFETTLAYEIFKAWLPRVAVRWELPNPKNNDIADLVVVDDSIPANPEAVFELKWWLENSAKETNRLAPDIEKLRKWTAPELYFVLFWWSEPAAWAQELTKTEELLTQPAFSGASPIFLASFETHAEHGGGGDECGDADSVMLVLDVSRTA